MSPDNISHLHELLLIVNLNYPQKIPVAFNEVENCRSAGKCPAFLALVKKLEKIGNPEAHLFFRQAQQIAEKAELELQSSSEDS